MRALIFGGGGQVGRAVALELAGTGWQVDAVTRGGRALDAPLVALGVNRLDAAASRSELVGRGYDAVVDTLTFNAVDAGDLLARAAGHYTVISTASVYADDQGRGFETDPEAGIPRYPDPILETQALAPPGPGYSAGKVAMELALTSAPVAILRPAAIHGIGARHPREWWFVKRALDGRHHVPIEAAGRSVFQTTSAQSIASLTRHCIEGGLTGAFNVADPTAASVAEIASLIGGLIGHDFTLIPLETPPEAADGVGHTPWSVPHPIRLTKARALATGWPAPPGYAVCLPDYLHWLAGHSADWQSALPMFRNYGHDPFDYAAEDAVLR